MARIDNLRTGRARESLEARRAAVRERTEKRCSRCEQVKALTLYRANRSKPDGRDTECAECARLIDAAGGEIARRMAAAQPALVDLLDRSARREELAAIGGRYGVHELRARIAAAARLKRMLCGRDIPADVLEAALPA